MTFNDTGPILRTGCALMLFCCLTIDAQPRIPPAPPLRLSVSNALIVIKDEGCTAAEGARIVFAQDEGHQLNGSGERRQFDTVQGTFDAEKVHASLRFPNMRTDCVPGEPDRINQRVIFTFHRCWKAVQNVTVGATFDIRSIRDDPPVPIGYVRQLKAGGKGTVPCMANGSFSPAEPYTVKAVRLPNEQLSLRVGMSELSINEVFHLIEGIDEGKSVPMDTDTMLYVMRSQGARGYASPPNFSGVSIDLDRRHLKQLNIRRLEVLVSGEGK